MKVLFFNPEQYVDFEDEPSNYQIRLPALNCGAISAHEDFVYQRTLKTGGRDAMHNAALAAYTEFKPDVVINSLCWWPECVDANTLMAIRQAGGKVISVYWDTWINTLPHETEIFLNSDLIMVMDSLTSYFKFRLLGDQHGRPNSALFSPIGVYTDLVKPDGSDKDIDVLMLGSNEGVRAELTRFLKTELAKLGINFQQIGGLVDTSGETEEHSKDWVGWPEYVDAINRSKICLNSQTRPDRFQIKGKIFDFMACNTLCLTDENPELRTFLPEDCVAYYSGQDDCLGRIVHFIENDSERRAIADNGYEWMRRNYDCKSFWTSILTSVASGQEQLPTLPKIEDAYTRLRENLDLVSRSHLSALNQLAQIFNSGQTFRRLPMRAEGSYLGLNILLIDGQHIVASDSMDLDFIELNNELHALSPSEGLLKIPDGEVLIGHQSKLFRAQTISQAKQIVDQLKKS